MNFDKIIIALDGMSKEEMKNFVETSHRNFSFYKIGMEAFYLNGRDFVVELHEKFNVKIFLDLKLYDIPNTVAGAIKSLAGLPIEFLTLHLQGGQEMLGRAIETRDKYLPNCKLLGVSFLTSYSEKDIQNIWNYSSSEEIASAFERLFLIAQKSNIDGVVCSALEVSQLKKKFPNLQAVCPGVRFKSEIESGKNIGDQKRVLSPAQAFSQGADYLVIGRSLTTKERSFEKSLSLLSES